MLPFADPTPESFLRELGFDATRLAAKSGRKYFLMADRRLSVTCWGDDKRPDYILIEYIAGSGFRAIVQTIERERIREEVAQWKRRHLASAAAS